MKRLFLTLLLKFWYDERGEMSFMGGGEGGSGDGGNAGGDAGGSGGSGNGDGGSGSGDGGAGDGPSYNYPSDLDSEYHGNKTLLKYADKESGEFKQAQLMKALVHATSNIGRDKMIIPNDTFTQEQWDETYKNLGRPDTAQEYGLKSNLPEGLEVDEKFLNSFQDLAHQTGVLPKQAQAMFDMINEQNLNSSKAQQESANAKYQEGVESLKAKWGDAYERKLTVAERTLNKFADEDQVKALAATGIFDNAQVTELFVKIGESLNEDVIPDDNTAGFGLTPDEIESKVQDLFNDPAFLNSRHPHFPAKRKEYEKLMGMKAGRKKPILI